MGIERLCLYMGLSHVSNPTTQRVREENDQVLAALKRHPDRLFGFAYVSGEHPGASVAEIDRLNILQASLLAMRRAIEALQPVVDLVLVDGNRVPPIAIASRAIVGGDAIEPAISAASILAKTHRDALMRALHRRYPEYGFARHFGYPTPQHLARLNALGPCAVHRRSFAPVRALLTLELGLD